MQEKYFSINKNKHSIRCKIYYNESEKLNDIDNVVISVHGFSGSKENNNGKKISAALLKKARKTLVIAFDLPCHGDDASKKISLELCDSYITMVVDFVKEKYSPNKIYYSAVSFGGYLGLKYINNHENPFSRITLRCPAVPMHYVLTENILNEDDLICLDKGKNVETGFERMVKITREFVLELKENDIMQFNYSKVSTNILIVHGTDDEIVPYGTVEDFTERNGISLITVDGANHTFSSTPKMDEAISAMSKFLLADIMS